MWVSIYNLSTGEAETGRSRGPCGQPALTYVVSIGPEENLASKHKVNNVGTTPQTDAWLPQLPLPPQPHPYLPPSTQNKDVGQRDSSFDKGLTTQAVRTESGFPVSTEKAGHGGMCP